MLHLWRAPHRNDDIWADEVWDDYGIKELKWKTENITAKQIDAGTVEITANLSATGKNDFTINHNVVYRVSGDGTINVSNDVNSNNPKLPIARMGVRLFLNKAYSKFKYFGRGPMENYSDRKIGSDVGIYSSSVYNN